MRARRELLDPQGQPSAARHSLLRRQALELSLYTFKYVDGVDSVTVFLPPPPGGADRATAVFLRRGDVKDELAQPLAQTIAPGAPSIGQIPARELQTLNRITRPRLYRYEYTQAQDLSRGPGPGSDHQAPDAASAIPGSSARRPASTASTGGRVRCGSTVYASS